MVPYQITVDNILQAIRFVSENSYPPERKSTKWDLSFEGEVFPPKYIISKASEYSKYGKFLFHNQFVTNEARARLTKLGFLIVPKDHYSNVVVLDDLISNTDNLSENDLLEALNKLKLLSPDRKKKIILATNRRDTPLIRLLKEIYNHACQMPGCNAEIITKDGRKYCEVAHIDPFSLVQKSELENLIVLCPNHHKEFDLGNLEITYRDKGSVKGRLNQRQFEFRLYTSLSRGIMKL